METMKRIFEYLKQSLKIIIPSIVLIAALVYPALCTKYGFFLKTILYIDLIFRFWSFIFMHTVLSKYKTLKRNLPKILDYFQILCTVLNLVLLVLLNFKILFVLWCISFILEVSAYGIIWEKTKKEIKE